MKAEDCRGPTDVVTTEDRKTECILLYLVPFLEAFHPSQGVYYPLFTRIKGVTFPTYLYPDFWLGRANGESIAAKAGHLSFIIILGMDLSFHL
jgi:hypothetical protein